MVLQFLLSMLFATSCCAHQSFEPLFLNGGVAPREKHADFPRIELLYSAEQIVKHVLQSSDMKVLCVLKEETEHDNLFLSRMNAIADELGLSLACIKTSSDQSLVASLSLTLKLSDLQPPCGILFNAGKAVLPLIASTPSHESLRMQVVQRVAFASAAKTYTWSQRLASWRSLVCAWVASLWSKISDYLFSF